MQVAQVQTVSVFQNDKETTEVVRSKPSQVTHYMHSGLSFTGILMLW